LKQRKKINSNKSAVHTLTHCSAVVVLSHFRHSHISGQHHAHTRVHARAHTHIVFYHYHLCHPRHKQQDDKCLTLRKGFADRHCVGWPGRRKTAQENAMVVSLCEKDARPRRGSNFSHSRTCRPAFQPGSASSQPAFHLTHVRRLCVSLIPRKSHDKGTETCEMMRV
jgi:hypothetical protein